MVTEYGMSSLGPILYEKRSNSVFLGRDYNVDKAFSDQVALEIDNEVRKIINDCYEIGKNTLSKHIDLLKLIAKYLLEIETLTKEDIYEIVDSGKLEWWEKKKLKLENQKIEAEEDSKTVAKEEKNPSKVTIAVSKSQQQDI